MFAGPAKSEILPRVAEMEDTGQKAGKIIENTPKTSLGMDRREFQTSSILYDETKLGTGPRTQQWTGATDMQRTWTSLRLMEGSWKK